MEIGIPKRDSDGAFAELKGNKYECFYYDNKDNEHALEATYSDAINKQYNYDKDLIESYAKPEVGGCTYIDYTDCNLYEGNIPGPIKNSNGEDCKYLYVESSSYYINTNEYKDMGDRFLTTLLLSLFVCLANIGLALFGFLLFRTPSEF